VRLPLLIFTVFLISSLYYFLLSFFHKHNLRWNWYYHFFYLLVWRPTDPKCCNYRRNRHLGGRQQWYETSFAHGCRSRCKPIRCAGLYYIPKGSCEPTLINSGSSLRTVDWYYDDEENYDLYYTSHNRVFKYDGIEMFHNCRSDLVGTNKWFFLTL
jgi:hypothetical protein